MSYTFPYPMKTTAAVTLSRKTRSTATNKNDRYHLTTFSTFSVLRKSDGKNVFKMRDSLDSRWLTQKHISRISKGPSHPVSRDEVCLADLQAKQVSIGGDRETVGGELQGRSTGVDWWGRVMSGYGGSMHDESVVNPEGITRKDLSSQVDGSNLRFL